MPPPYRACAVNNNLSYRLYCPEGTPQRSTVRAGRSFLMIGGKARDVKEKNLPVLGSGAGFRGGAADFPPGEQKKTVYFCLTLPGRSRRIQFEGDSV